MVNYLVPTQRALEPVKRVMVSYLVPTQSIGTSEENTLMRGVIPDQSALHGVLAQVRDLGLVLVSLNGTID